MFRDRVPVTPHLSGRSTAIRSVIEWIARRFAAAGIVALGGLALLSGGTERASAQEQPARLDVYGFAMMDMGYQAGQNDPDWFDVVRPTKLPAVADEFGKDGRTFFSVRQTRFGVKGFIPTPLGELRTTFELELFGTGVDAGQTTLRLRHAYGELGHFGAGQTWSPFMDIDVFPNSVESWGPNGMVFFRNVQVRWMPVQGESRVTFALERPGASADGGDFADRIALRDVTGRFPAPDLSAEARKGGAWGYAELAGIVRYMRWDDLTNDSLDLSGEAVGWGAHFSSNLKLGKTGVIRLSGVYGRGIENYMNDAPVDIGVKAQPGNPTAPIAGEALPVLGVVAFYDHTWNSRFSNSIGYSLVDIRTSDLQTADAFKRGHYALANVLYYPAPGVMTGVEFQWGRRENNRDGWTVNDYRVQFSFKYDFSATIGGTK
jgi:hypothetical protein